MSDDVRARIAAALAAELEIRRGTVQTWADHITGVLLSLPDVVVVDRDSLILAIAAGIQGYASDEGSAYSYHGDGSALEAMDRLERDAKSIAQYILTHAEFRQGAEKSNCPDCGSTNPDRVHYGHCPTIGSR